MDALGQEEAVASSAPLALRDSTVAQLQAESASLEREIVAIEQEYTRRLEALGRQPAKQKQMVLSLVLFVVGSLLFLARSYVPALLVMALAIGLAFDGYRCRRRAEAEKMRVWEEGEAIWSEKQAALAARRKELESILSGVTGST